VSTVVLSDKRQKLIAARAKEGFDVEDLVDAARGWRRSKFHCGANEGGKVYNSVELIFRDAAHVEAFRDMERDTAAGVAAIAPHDDPILAQMRRLREYEGRA
jgi:hypothetical protein